jgi:hypothetical protein
MNFLIKLFPKVIIKKIKDYLNIPKNIYQNVHMPIKLDEYHIGDFDLLHNKFCLNDLHLNKDKNVTRFRNYISYKFAEYAIMNNCNKENNFFLSVGISYGTTLKVITHLLDNKLQKNNINDIEYFLIDNYKDVGNANYNTDIYNVKKDLTNIKKFKFNFIEDLLNHLSFDKVKDGLIFTHLNFGNYETEIEFLPKIINKTKRNGVIILDYYGWYNHKTRERLDQIILDNKTLFKIVFPSLQCVLIKL